ncbi:Crp/Fnr family transcriptional regulator [Leptospira barantonii]|uniref:Cyclic nucleotide-binding protein n=1 Tax=Leptospira barantonii TaxID=2023184 RepID=A0ABX4NP47_9LEPT|nr:Crp/Fnr family transcriptional regulator [Leptospira barantonii]PJZ58607.1 cyclic nucleotide-binding protein [Leptospira barantonii]
MKNPEKKKNPIDSPVLKTIKKKFPFLESKWEEYESFFKEKKIPAKTTLLRQGEISKYVYFIEEGCLRLGFDENGKDITFQFFFEGSGVASMESFKSSLPSLFFLESVEPCKLIVIHRNDALYLFEKHEEFKNYLIEFLFARISNYTRLFLSRIKDSPEERYKELIRQDPKIMDRIPHHYIASYLGITPVSLSRIRNRTRS